MKETERKEISKGKKIYNIVSTVIVGVIFVFLVVVVGLTVWQRKSGGDSSIFGYYMFEVLTDSMSGTIEPGEVIISKKVDDANTLKVDDVVTFIAPSGPLAGRNETHRIIEIKKDDGGNILYIRTQGDNEVAPDNWRLNAGDIKAIYVRKSPFIAGFRNFLSHWYGYVLLIALPLCVVGILFIIGYVRDKIAKDAVGQAEEAKPTLESMSDEEKKKLLEAFLIEQNAEKSKISDENPDNSEENPADESGVSSDGEEN